MKRTKLEIVHANNIASIIQSSEFNEAEERVKLYKRVIKEDLEQEVSNLHISYSMLEGVGKIQNDRINAKFKKIDEKEEEIDSTQQFFYGVSGFFLLIASIMFIVAILKNV